MNVVIDTNVLIAALLKDGKIREIIVNPRENLHHLGWSLVWLRDFPGSHQTTTNPTLKCVVQTRRVW